MQRHNIKVAIAIIKYNHCSSVSAAVGPKAVLGKAPGSAPLSAPLRLRSELGAEPEPKIEKVES